MEFIDRRNGRLGQFIGRNDGGYLLRPLSGGREWSVPADQVRPATATERLRAGLHAVNRASAARP